MNEIKNYIRVGAIMVLFMLAENTVFFGKSMEEVVYRFEDR